MLLDNLPSRIFLDSSTLQTLKTYGQFIWDGVSIDPNDVILKIPDGVENLNALKNVFLVNQRANFEFALSRNSLREVEAMGDNSYLQWAFEVLDHWQLMIDTYERNPFDSKDSRRASKVDMPSFGYLGSGDRRLIKDAIMLGCDAFLTMERKLPKNARHIYRELRLLILTPIQYWDLLKPVASLFY
jgi:hypothetical protein